MSFPLVTRYLAAGPVGKRLGSSEMTSPRRMWRGLRRRLFGTPKTSIGAPWMHESRKILARRSAQGRLLAIFRFQHIVVPHDERIRQPALRALRTRSTHRFRRCDELRRLPPA